MGDFKRGLGPQLLSSLTDESLFCNELMDDIKGGNVFFGNRYRCASFYYKGRSLFKYEKNAFSANHKFAVIAKNLPDDYITESDLSSINVGLSFKDNYTEIKNRANQYKDPEADGVSALYKSAVKSGSNKDDIYLLDIEISLAKPEKEEGKKRRGTDRIDLLLYNNTDCRLMFCEAKHYTNDELWVEKPEEPPVVKQISRYHDQIKSRYDSLLDQYSKVIDEYNELLDVKLNRPKKICKKCGLYVFGYDSVWENEVCNRLEANAKRFGFAYRAIGRTTSDSARKIYQSLVGKLK